MTEPTLTTTEPGQAPALSDIERQALADQESQIERGLKTFYEVGMALAMIRDGRLYRERYATFEDYAWDRWQLKRPRAYELMDAAKVTAQLSEISDTPPTVESHAAAMKGLDQDDANVVWEVVRETAPEGKVTEIHVKSVVQVFKEVKEFTITHNSERSDLMKSLVTEETTTRMQLQQLYVTTNNDPPKRLVNGEREIHNMQRSFLTFRITPEEYQRLMSASDNKDKVRLVIYEVRKGDGDADTELSAEKP